MHIQLPLYLLHYMKKLFCCSLAALATLCVQARQLTPAEALTRAIGTEAASYTTPSRGGEISLAYTGADATSGINGLYVFNRSADNGFIVVSADDVVTPILGYAYSGTFDVCDMPDNLRAWLEEYTAQIAWASTMTPNTSRAATTGRPSRTSISPMCKTFWNQSSPFNDLCPVYEGKRCVSGCVATAMTQAMKYHNYPDKGSSSHSYTTDSLKLSLSFDYSNTTFEWDKMLSSYTSDSSSEEKKAVATLTYAAGVAVNMNYRPNESSAQSFLAGKALIEYFNYDKGLSYHKRNWYGLYEWEDLVYESLSTCGPVLISGGNSSGAHEFVCDGYDKDGYFHINWGWSGISDGYFLLTALDPISQGIGGSNGGYNFYQDAVIGIRPPVADSKYVETISALSDLGGEGSYAKVRVTGSFANQSYTTLSNLSFGLEINGKVYETSYSYASLLSTYNVKYFDVSLPNLSAGTYKAYPVFKTANNSWQRIKTLVSSDGWLELSVDSSGYVSVVQQAAPTISISDLQLDSHMIPGSIYSISANIANNGNKEYVNSIYPILVNSNNETIELTQYLLDLPAGESSTITIRATLRKDIALGSYTLSFAEKSDKIFKPIGIGIPVTVEEYIAPALSVSALSIENSDAVDPDNITVHTTISNQGGYFFGQLYLVIYPYIPGTTVPYAGDFYSPFIEIPANTINKNITFSGSFPKAEAGKTYFVVIYNVGSPQAIFTVGSMTGIQQVGEDNDVTSIEVYTPAGVRVPVPSDVISAETLSNTDLPAGLYIMIYNHADGRRTSQKVVKR